LKAISAEGAKSESALTIWRPCSIQRAAKCRVGDQIGAQIQIAKKRPKIQAKRRS